MNEPASFVEGSIKGCNDNQLVYPIFKPGKLITNPQHFNHETYNVENLETCIYK